MIRIPQVRVVDEEGTQLGVMPTPKALEMAQERGYDLVEVAPMASPPVVRFLDFGQYKYELTKREKEAKRRQRAVEFKEVRLTPKIGSGDFLTKVHRAVEFLEEGDRIKVTVRFRGRELTHPELGRNLLFKFADQIKEHGTVERAPTLEGKQMHITIASVHKPKFHEPPARTPRPEQSVGSNGEVPAPSPVKAQPAAPAPQAAAPGPNGAAPEADAKAAVTKTAETKTTGTKAGESKATEKKATSKSTPTPTPASAAPGE